MPVKIIENTGCILSGSDQCCHHTLDLMIKDMALA
jgi:hypothetical protein